MPGAGELALVAYGNQNKLLVSGNPEYTNFYKIYKHYTHFSQENISIPLDGPNELMMDTPIRVRAKIPRHADLLTDLMFVFRVPDIYSKIYDVAVGQDQESYAPAFRWIHMLGAIMIDTVAIFVGGTKIQEFTGEWLMARAHADYSTDKYLKWREMVGSVPELHTPEWGIYGKSPNYPYAQGEYPHAMEVDPAIGAAPSIPGRTMRVPLPFWFSEKSGSALPLVSLQLHDVEVQITLRTLREVYRIMDLQTQREPLRWGRELVIDPSLPTSVDPLNPSANDNLTLQANYQGTANPTVGPLRNFFTDVFNPVPIQDGFIMDMHLEGNYVYLTREEQVRFVERELHTLVHQIQLYRFPGVVTRTKLDLDCHNLVHRILFFGRRSDAIEERNDYINCSNWKNLTQAPYSPIPAASVANSGYLIPFSQREILKSARLMCAGNELFEEKPAQFYELQMPFTTTTGGGTSAPIHNGLRPDTVMGPLYQLPFALNASDHEQPSGTLNTSRLRDIQLEVQPWPLDPNSPYVYDFTVYVESLNMVKLMNGMGSLAFAI